MNEFARVGKGDEYVEVCIGRTIDLGECVHMFKDCFADGAQEDLKKAVLEVFGD